MKELNWLEGIFNIFKKILYYIFSIVSNDFLGLYTVFKGYLCYKTITSQNVPSEARFRNLFIS